MRLMRLSLAVVLPLFAAIAFNPAFADEPIPITAEEAFEAAQMQIDPLTGDPASVVLVDVRDPLEVFSSGAAASVKEIEFSNRRGLVEPDWGKVRLVHNGKFIEYHKDGRYNRAKVDTIKAISLEPIAYNIKLWGRVEDSWNRSQEDVDAFDEELNNFLTIAQPEVVILYCRTGGRSGLAGKLILNGYYELGKPPTRFDGDSFPYPYVDHVYEIDDPDGENGRGGFTGSDYGKVFNGYAGFPGRLTDTQDVPSASWKDAGLPVIREALKP